MSRLPLSLAVLIVAVGCGGKPKAPDLEQRDLPQNPMVNPVVDQGPGLPDLSDGGVSLVDAGCCVVPFALRSNEGEVAAYLYFPPLGDVAMGKDDAGVWRVNACVPLASDVYVYHVAYPTDDDAGVLLVDRVNDAVPTQFGGGVASEANVFDVGDGGTCGGFDGGIHSSLPDGG